MRVVTNVAEARQRLGRLGVFLGGLALAPASELRQGAAALEAQGWGALWCGEAFGREVFSHAALVLAATERLVVGTAIANIWARDATATANASRTLAEGWPGRFVLGLGVSHRALLDARGSAADLARPVHAMRIHLDWMAAAEYRAAQAPCPAPVLLAALGPRMLDLAAERGDGALTYLAPVAHTRLARARLGPNPLLVVEQAAVLAARRSEAREAAGRHLRTYLRLPAYRRHLLRLGFSPAELEDDGSEHLFDALVVWGGPDAVMERVQEQLAAGADHVAVHMLAPTPAPETELLGRLPVSRQPAVR